VTVTPYDVLGVAPTATPDEVEAAHHRLALMYNPGAYEMAPRDVRVEFEQRMKQINEAYEELRTNAAAHQSAASQVPSADHSKHQEAASYTGPYCVLCGSAPVVPVELKQGIGLLFWRRVKTFAGTVCRDCGTAMYRTVQNRTLWTGWWGIISFFDNFVFIFSNLGAYRSIRRLASPSPTPKSHITPLQRPAARGRSLFGKSGVWFAAVAVVAIGLVVLAVVYRPTSPGGLLNETIVEDDFSDPNTGWKTSTNKSATIGYMNGTYRMVLKKPHQDRSSLEIHDTSFGAVSVEVDVKSTGAPGVVGVECVTGQRSGSYDFFIWPETGEYVIGKFNKTSGAKVLTRGENTAVHSGTNHIKGECVGATGRKGTVLTMWVNGQYVTRFNDPHGFQTFDGIGLFIASLEKAPTEAAFDNALMSRL
jgi:hypothetical protein